MYGVEYEIQTVGEAISAHGSKELASVLHACAQEASYIKESILEDNSPAGSEDATFFMERVQQNGGQATYCIFGTELAAGHHNEKFDINEGTMMNAVQLLFESIKKLN